jgi:hypothetical protein
MMNLHAPLKAVTRRIVSWGQSRNGSEFARGNRSGDTEGFCKSQMALHNGLRRLRATLGCFRWNGRNSVPDRPRGHPENTLRLYGRQPVGTLKPPREYPENTLRLPRDYGWATSIPDLAAIEPGKPPWLQMRLSPGGFQGLPGVSCPGLQWLASSVGFGTRTRMAPKKSLSACTCWNAVWGICHARCQR